MINCVHPVIFDQAVSKEIKHSKKTVNRIMGFQANTSAKSPEELDNLSCLDTSKPGEFADLMIKLHHKFKIKILGGCCGSDSTHINEIARKLKEI